jgi:hypothetical protein
VYLEDYDKCGCLEERGRCFLSSLVAMTENGFPTEMGIVCRRILICHRFLLYLTSCGRALLEGERKLILTSSILVLNRIKTYPN